MSLMMQTREEIQARFQSNILHVARIMIVSDDDSDTKRLVTLLLETGFILQCTHSIAAACEAAKSGQYQVVVSTPRLRDGSWRRLADVANHYELHFEIVLWARNFDLREWAEALDIGAFDILDALYEQSRAVEAIKCALWAAYLKGAGPNLIFNQLEGRL